MGTQAYSPEGTLKCPLTSQGPRNLSRAPITNSSTLLVNSPFVKGLSSQQDCVCLGVEGGQERILIIFFWPIMHCIASCQDRSATTPAKSLPHFVILTNREAVRATLQTHSR